MQNVENKIKFPILKNTNDVDCGHLLNELIVNKGVTYYEVSKATGISQSTLSRARRNKTKKLNLKNIEILAKYFEVREVWLSTGKGESKISPSKQDEEEKPLKYQEMVSKLLLQNERLVAIIEKQAAIIEKSNNSDIPQ